MCGCNKGRNSRNRRSTPSVANTRRQAPTNARLVANNNGTQAAARLAAKAFQNPPDANTAAQRARIEKLRKETLLRRFGKL